LRHFDGNGEPIVSRDKGYGISQLTDPRPTYPEIWNWKLNVSKGLQLFSTKMEDAYNWLARDNRAFTPAQLQRETISRWNGGRYHVWQDTSWVRNPNILCDSQTTNNGWDLTWDGNRGKSEAILHARDQDDYRSLFPPDGALWRHYGICYVDHLLR
jgi:hypothetical protein